MQKLYPRPVPGARRAESRGGLRGDVTQPVLALCHRLPRVWRVRHGHKGAILNGISGQGTDLHRLRRGFCFYRRGTTVFSRQTIQERAQALQNLQVQTRGCSFCSAHSGQRAPLRSCRNSSHLLPVRQRDYGALPPHARSSHLLPRVLHAEKDRGCLLNAGKISAKKAARALSAKQPLALP
jgi:hypothetical protein